MKTNANKFLILWSLREILSLMTRWGRNLRGLATRNLWRKSWKSSRKQFPSIPSKNSISSLMSWPTNANMSVKRRDISWKSRSWKDNKRLGRKKRGCWRRKGKEEKKEKLKKLSLFKSRIPELISIAISKLTQSLLLTFWLSGWTEEISAKNCLKGQRSDLWSNFHRGRRRI